MKCINSIKKIKINNNNKRSQLDGIKVHLIFATIKKKSKKNKKIT